MQRLFLLIWMLIWMYIVKRLDVIFAIKQVRVVMRNKLQHHAAVVKDVETTQHLVPFCHNTISMNTQLRAKSSLSNSKWSSANLCKNHINNEPFFELDISLRSKRKQYTNKRTQETATLPCISQQSKVRSGFLFSNPSNLSSILFQNCYIQNWD